MAPAARNAAGKGTTKRQSRPARGKAPAGRLRVRGTTGQRPAPGQEQQHTKYPTGRRSFVMEPVGGSEAEKPKLLRVKRSNAPNGQEEHERLREASRAAGRKRASEPRKP